MKYFFGLVSTALFFLSSCSQPTTFYVSPDGDDRNKGTENDPFATPERAMEAVRSALIRERETDLTVYLSGGIYYIDEPLVFGPELSGQDTFRITYKAMLGEDPVISGGIEIDKWKSLGQDRWVAKVPDTGRGKWYFRELFINASRAKRARHPNSGFNRIAEAGMDKRTFFYYNHGDFPLPEKPEDVELVLLHDWSCTRIRIKELDPGNQKITAVDSIGAKCLSFFTLDNWEPHPRYFLENSITFLDEPYEWFLDSTEDLLYLNLPPGINPESCRIVAPVAEKLLLLEGLEDDPVRNIIFEGLTFSHCAFSLPESGYAGIQACHYDPREGGRTWNTVPTSVEGRWLENIIFEDCSWEHLGGSGIRLGTGARNCLVSNSRFKDISGNAIMIGEGNERLIGESPWWQSAPGQVAIGNRIENCQVTAVGQQFFGAVGIWSGITAGTIFKNNDISSLPYTGISAGWLWSAEPTPCREVRIEGNHIHHIMQVLSDGGGIYTLGLQPGGMILNNHIHDVEINAGKAESNGMFLDEGTSGMTIANNLIYNTAKSPLRFHRASTNMVRENVLVCGEGMPPVRYNNTPVEKIKLEENMILSASSHEDLLILEKMISDWKKK